MYNTFFAIAYDMDSANFDIKQFECEDNLEEFCDYCAEPFVEYLSASSNIWKNVESGRNKAVFYDPKASKGIVISAKNHHFD